MQLMIPFGPYQPRKPMFRRTWGPLREGLLKLFPEVALTIRWRGAQRWGFGIAGLAGLQPVGRTACAGSKKGIVGDSREENMFSIEAFGTYDRHTKLRLKTQELVLRRVLNVMCIAWCRSTFDLFQPKTPLKTPLAMQRISLF